MNREELLKIAKPILFNTEMVWAILDGRKTETRRCVKFKSHKNPNWTGYIMDGLNIYNGNNEICNKKPQFKPGDILYVRETWAPWSRTEGLMPKIHYKTDGEDLFRVKWRPSIHMPKEAARIFLKVEDVRLKRLQDITQPEAKAEGCAVGEWGLEPIIEFSKLWNSTIKKSDLDTYGWDANPWVWVIEFERIEPDALDN